MSADSTPANQSKLWGGRFDRPPNELFYEFQRSFPFDRRLLPYELAVDRVWAQGLRRAGVLSAPECERTLAALDEIAGKAGRAGMARRFAGRRRASLRRNGAG